MTSDRLKTTLRELEKLGTEATRKIYLRHGASEPLYGVKFGDLNKVKKKLGQNHDLAHELWATGNSDARTLALMIVDPEAMRSGEIDQWLRPLKYDLLIGMLCGVTARTKFAESKWKKWSRSKSERSLVAAYNLLAHWLKERPDEVPDQVLRDALKQIQSSIHQSPNLARHAMNNGLIAIGVYRETHRKDAIAVARKIGTVEVDHGETNCKTPDAASYIDKSVQHNRKRIRC